MKKINLGGRVLQYKVKVTDSEGWTTYESNFYEGTITKTYRKYLFFGKKLSVKVPKHIFTLWEDIERDNLSKEECRKKIQKALDSYDAKNERINEIKKGELI